MDKLKEAKQYLSMEKFLGFKDIVGTLEEKLNEWPSVLVWSSAERIGEMTHQRRLRTACWFIGVLILQTFS